LNELIKKLFTQFTDRLHEVSVSVDGQGKIIESKEVLDSLKPDQITTLNAKIHTKWDAKRDQATSATAPSGPSASTTDNFDLISDDDISWDGAGTAIVPKSVRLHQVNNAALEEMSSLRFTSSDAGLAAAAYEGEATFVEKVANTTTSKLTDPVRFEIKKMQQLHPGQLSTGGIPDRDIGSGNHPTHYRMWYTNPIAEADGIHLTVFTEVQEGVHDWTRLTGSTDITVPLPSGFVKLEGKKIRQYDAPDYNVVGKYSFNFALTGKKHDFVDIPIPEDPSRGMTLVRDLSIRPDGPGDDDDGNAAAKGKVVIPYLGVPPGQSEFRMEYSLRH